MKNNHKTYDQIQWDQLSKYISGEMNDEEKIGFEKNIAEDAEYQALLALTQQDLHAVHEFQTKEMNFNPNLAWKKLDSRIKHWENEQSLRVKRPNLFLRIARVAAVVLAFVALSVTAYLILDPDKGQEIVVSSLHEQGKILKLSDGTTVELNAGAEIKFPKQFKGNKRMISFQGEGFFTVTPNPEKPFIINTANAKVTVLGTSFNVNSNEQITEVLVSSGKVSLSGLKMDPDNLILQKGDLGTLLNNQLIRSTQTDANYLSWKTQQMIFNETPLSEVLDVVEKTYNVEIKTTENISDKLLLTSTFDREDLEIILESISKTFNLTYKKEGRNIVYSQN